MFFGKKTWKAYSIAGLAARLKSILAYFGLMGRDLVRHFMYPILLLNVFFQCRSVAFPDISMFTPRYVKLSTHFSVVILFLESSIEIIGRGSNIELVMILHFLGLNFNFHLFANFKHKFKALWRLADDFDRRQMSSQ